MKVLVVNCGSSSIKYQLINMENEEVMAKGYLEKIGLPDSFLTHTVNGEKHRIEKVITNHEDGIKLVLDQLLDANYGVIKDLKEIDAIGHRVVHGGEKFSDSVIITDEVIDTMKECIPLAPLHNPAGITGIEACRKVLPEVPMVGVFDTAFIKHFQKKHIFMQFHMNIMRNIEFVNMVSTEHLINLFQEEVARTYGKTIRRFKNGYMPFRTRWKFMCC